MLAAWRGFAADKLVARTMSQSVPWIAEETGLLKKYGLDFLTRLHFVGPHGDCGMPRAGGDAGNQRVQAIVRAARA